MTRPLVFDTAGLIALARLELLESVNKEFGQVLVPRAVFDEATVDPRPGADAIRLAGERNWIAIVDSVIEPSERTSLSLGAGEVATIALAESVAGVAVLDDRDARRVARQRGISLTGTVAILVRLGQIGAIASLADVLVELESIGFRATEELRAWAPKAAGE